MARWRLKRWCSKQTPGEAVRRAGNPRRRDRVAAAVEALDRRVMLSVTAMFAEGTLRVTGDDQDNVITISRTAGGAILVNNGAVPIQGAAATAANTTHFHVVGGGGNDNISLNEANGPLAGAAIFGGTGNDTLTGGSGADFIDGNTGNDTAFMGPGDDTFAWNSGDGSDVVNGQAGTDTLVFNGSDLAESFDLSDTGNGSPFHRARITRDVGNVAMDLSTVEDIDLNALGGADTVTINDLTLTDLFTVNLDLTGSSGAGDNASDSVILNGSNADDVAVIQSVGTRIAANVSLFPFVNIAGEDGLDALTVNTLGGNDVVDASALAATNASQLVKLTVNGGAGNDSLTGSQGADTFVWNPGDGNDTIDGGDNPDTLVFNGSNVSERLDLSASGKRVRLTRDVDGVATDLGDVESITISALGGADTATLNDLTGTAVTQVNLNLAGAIGGIDGDGGADFVTVNARNAPDLLPVLGNNGVVAVDGGFGHGSGLPYFVVLRVVEATDALRVNGNGGDDTIDASALQTPVKLIADGGAGNDTLLGSHGSDAVFGGPGNDVAFLGDGDDSFTWNAGDGSDRVEGLAGTDTLNFNGSNFDENIALSANGPQVRVTDDVGNVAIDLDGVEQTAVSAMGGTDNVVVNDLTGTALAALKVTNIADLKPDNVTVNTSNNAETISVTGEFANGVMVSGLPAVIRILGAVATEDRLTVNTLGGADIVDASGLRAGALTLALNGGGGADVLTSSEGDDLINGGTETDTINVTGAAANGVVTLLPSSGDDTVNVNSDGIGSARVRFDATQRIGALNIGSGGAATLTPGGTKVLTVTSLFVTGTGTLNLGDNAFVLDYSGASPVGTIQSLLKSGYNAGAWNGPGIISNRADASAFALGFAEASDVAPGGTFAGQNVDASSVLVKFTRYGDANLDGAVNGADFARLAGNFGRTGRLWSNGDFNYDEGVNGADFALLGGNFGKAAPPAQASVVDSLPHRRRR
jgi:Ca2+-binding RTX toxin-like protein